MKKNLLSLFQIFDICLYFIDDKEPWIINLSLACFLAVYSMGFVYWGSNIFIQMIGFDVLNGNQKGLLILLSFLLGVMFVRLIAPNRNDFYNEYSKLEPVILTMWFKLVFALVVVLTSILNTYVAVKFGSVVVLVYLLELIIIPYGFFWFAKTQDEISKKAKNGPE